MYKYTDGFCSDYLKIYIYKMYNLNGQKLNDVMMKYVR